MSYSTRFSTRLPRSVTERVDFTLIEDFSDDQSISADISASTSTDEITISLQDLCSSPEFIEEQKLILLEIEAAQLRIAEDERSISIPLPEEQTVDCRRSRRSSVGIKLTCPICLESLTSVTTGYVKMVTQCGHIFCQDCIKNVCKVTKKFYERQDADFDVQTLCPVCREEIGELRKVYF